MSNTDKSDERARQLLLPRERPMLLVRIHGAAYILPFLMIACGLFVQFIDAESFGERFIDSLKYRENFIDFLSSIQESPLGIFFVIFGAIMLVQVFFSKRSHVQMITTLRVVQEIGLWTKEFHEIYLSEIKDVKVKRTFFDVLSHRGNVTIIHKIKHKEEGKTNDIFMPGVTDPKEFKRILLDVTAKYGKHAIRQKKTKEYG